PAAQAGRQLSCWARPSMVTRHSAQMPMPQSGARPSPATERRKTVTPASPIAAATVVPAGTRRSSPLIFMSTLSMQYLVEGAGRRIRLDCDLSRPPEQLGGEEPGRGQGRGDAG